MQKGEQLPRKNGYKGRLASQAIDGSPRMAARADLEKRTREGLLNYQRLKMLLPWLEEYEDGYL